MVRTNFEIILIGCFALATLSWTLVGVGTFIHDRKREKRDTEYHLKRMKQMDK